MKSKSNKISTNIWIYLSVFSLVLMIFLWIFQVLFLQLYYEAGVKNNLNKVVNKVSQYKYKDINSYIENLAYQNNVCIEIVSKNEFSEYVEVASKNCQIEGKTYDNYKIDFINKNSKSKTYELINSLYNNKTIVKAIRQDNTYIFISSSLEVVGSTIYILGNMFIFVTIIVLILALLIGYFISKRISKPIINITEKAEMLKNGNYDIDFSNKDSIYEINKLEETLTETAQMLSQTENIRREFLANVSHDIKTPLTMIKAYAEMIRDITYKDDQKREENLNIIIEEAERLNLLVNDILELSKIQSSVVEDKKEQLDLNKLIKEILTRYDIYVEDGYSFIYKEVKDAIIYADKKRIEQIIYNLINNAIVYTGEDKKIYIELENNKKNIVIKIRDTGKGIKQEEIKNIWKKYYKIDRSHKRDKVGSGIGLSIVKSICDANGYNYGVISEENKGSCFYIKIKK